MAEHPIQVPHELICELQASVQGDPCPIEDATFCITSIATRAAQWGADQELEACCEWVGQWCGRSPDGRRPEDDLRAARRPKPPSLKEEALEQLDCVEGILRNQGVINTDMVRRAIEALPDE